MHRLVECFYPGESFPAVSVTGRACALDCKHCARKYLEGMAPATSPDELVSLAEAIAERGGKGMLISGGADEKGRVRLGEFAEAIAAIKATTDLKINAHIGIAPEEEIRLLVKSGVDSFSVDVYGSDETIHEVLGLNARTEDYFRVLETLRDDGAPIIAPHMCVGIHRGQLKGEFSAIERLRSFGPDRLILISLIPTRGTAFAEVSPPSKADMISVIAEARHKLPRARIILGCMRSKKDRSAELDMIAAGLDGIVLPSTSTVEHLRRSGVTVKKRALCCSL